MNLTVTNMSPRATVVSVIDGTAQSVDELAAGVSVAVSGDCTIAVVGDKPTLEEQFFQAGQLVRELLRKVRDRLARQNHAELHTDTVHVGIANHGKLPVRAILGDGVTDEQIAPGAVSEVVCKGYVELRELGHVPGSDDPAQQTGYQA